MSNSSNLSPQNSDVEGISLNENENEGENSLSLDEITGTENLETRDVQNGKEVPVQESPDTNPTISLNKFTGTNENKDIPPKVPELINFNPAKWQEFTRIGLVAALVLNVLLTIVVTGCFIFVPMFISSSNKSTDDKEKNENLIKLNNQAFVYIVKEDKNKGSQELINLLWTSQMTLLSGAIGFYFASKNFTKD